MEKLFAYCSENCLKKKHNNLIKENHGQTEATKNVYIVDENNFLINTERSNRNNMHPLGEQDTNENLQSALTLIMNNPHKNLMRVNEVCQCSACVNIVEGMPLYNASTTPGWIVLKMGRKDYLSINEKVECEVWQKQMSELTDGLLHLHRLGLSHGDPYPFNVMINNSGEAIWIDYGNVTSDKDYLFRDIYAFIFYVVMFTVKYCDAVSESLLGDIARSIIDNVNNDVLVLDNIKATFEQKRTDWVFNIDENIYWKNFYSIIVDNCGKLKTNILSQLIRVIELGNSQYYESFLYWMKSGSKMQRSLEIEREKFKLYSSEIDRLTVPKYVYDALIQQNNDFIEENNQLRNDLEEENKRNNFLFQKANENEKRLVEVCDWADYLTQLLDETNKNHTQSNMSIMMTLKKIEEILNGKRFRLWIRFYAYIRKFFCVRLGEKVKLIGKTILHLFGRKTSMGLNEFDPTEMIKKYVQSIHGIIKCSMNNKNENEYTQKEICEKENEIKNENEYIPTYTVLPKVTVLLPVYNHAEFVHKAIDSILNQTYSNIELILINDGSTDGLDEKIRKYQNDYRFKYYTQPNQKLPMTLSHLHELADGDYVTWTSADNIMEPNMIETLVDEIQRRPDAVMIFGDVRLIDENDEPLIHQDYRDFNRDLINPEILHFPCNLEPLGEECDNYINACFMYKRIASQTLGNQYASDLVGLEDYDYWLRMQRCGKIIHTNTKEPLYRYRVHKNTMSEELLTTKRQKHIERSQKMINMEKQRAEWAKKRWNVIFEGIPAHRKNEIVNNLETIPVNICTEGQKNFYFYNCVNAIHINETKSAHCYCVNDEYQLGIIEEGHWKKRISIPIGNVVNPLALKARYTHMPAPYYEYNNADNKFVIGCHVNIDKININDVLNIIREHKEFYFVFVNTIDKSVDEFLHSIANETNAVYLGYRPFGVPYMMYSSWNATLIPKMTDKLTDNEIYKYYQLSLALGKWCSYFEKYECLNGKLFTVPHGDNNDFDSLLGLANTEVDYELMDQQLETLSPVNILKNLFDFANGMLQDLCVERPDFEINIPKETKPVLVKRAIADEVFRLKQKYIAIVVDTLDKGGMEQVVAMIARKFVQFGVKIKVLCILSGGLIAEDLKREGIQVEEFGGDKRKYKEYLKEDRPIIVNSHFLHNCCEIPHELGIPVVETIHNMYAFFDMDAWTREKNRSQYIDKYIAVSEMVKKYYCSFNNSANAADITVIGNAAEPGRVSGRSKGILRTFLGISSTDFVFAMVASFDGRKNQIGLITAFSEASKMIDGDVKLLLIGNVLDQNYYDKCKDYIGTLGENLTIKIVPYRKDVASIYADVDVFIISSYIEGWSISATEALYAGKELIHTNCGSGKELCENGDFGILIDNPFGNPLEMDQNGMYTAMANVKPKNNDELVNAIIESYNNRQNWKNRGPVNRSRAISDFNYDNMVEEYAKVFCEVAVEDL